MISMSLTSTVSEACATLFPRRYDFTQADNSFQAVDNIFLLAPRVSLSLRILFMLLGGGTTSPAPELKEHLGSFLDFVTWVNLSPYKDLLMQHLTVQHVVLMARMVWKVRQVGGLDWGQCSTMHKPMNLYH